MKNFTLFSLLVFSTQALAMGTFNSFVPDTAISADKMNTNFIMTKTAVDNLEATNIGYYVFPTLLPSVGQVLTSTATGLAWQLPGGGGSGITSINGDTSMVQNFTVGTTGSMPAFNSGGGNHILNIPLASMVGTNAGLISYSDYMTFQNKLTAPSGMTGQVLTYSGSTWMAMDGFIPNGNNASSPLKIGTNTSFPFSIKTNGMDQLTIDPGGFVNIGGAPTGMTKLSVDAGAVNAVNGAIISGEGTLQGTMGTQYGMIIKPTIYQNATAGYTGLKVAVDDQSTTSSGPRKLLELTHNTQPVMTVNPDGYFTSASSWMGSLMGSVTVNCQMSEPTFGQHTQINNPGMVVTDFGTFSTTFPSGVYEIIIDTPFTGNYTDIKLTHALYENSNVVPLNQGRNIKRFTGSSFTIALGCVSASGGAVATMTSNKAVIGIRKLH